MRPSSRCVACLEEARRNSKCRKRDNPCGLPRQPEHLSIPKVRTFSIASAQADVKSAPSSILSDQLVYHQVWA
jgi:hypothetical protein